LDRSLSFTLPPDSVIPACVAAAREESRIP